MALEVDPILRLGEFAVRPRTGEGVLGDEEHRVSQCEVYTGVTAGPTLDSRTYGMLNGKWVAFKKKVTPVEDPNQETPSQQDDPTNPDDTENNSGSGD